MKSTRNLVLKLAIPALMGARIGGAVFGVGFCVFAAYLVGQSIGDAEGANPPESDGVPFTCDCMTIDWGLLTKEYRGQCIDREDEMASLVGGATHPQTVAMALNLHLSYDGSTIVGGELCDPVAHGESAWPVNGSPAQSPLGLSQWPNQQCNPIGLGRHCLDTKTRP